CSPGPKFAAAIPRRASWATSVHACFASTGAAVSARNSCSNALSRMAGPPGSETEVEVQLAAGRHHVAAGEALDAGGADHLAVDELAGANLPRRLILEPREQRTGLVDGVVALPRTRRVRALAREGEGRVQRAAAAEL